MFLIPMRIIPKNVKVFD